MNRFLYKNSRGASAGAVPSPRGSQAAPSSLQSARECQGQVLGVAVGETEQKTPELRTGQVGDGGLAAGSAELLLLPRSLRQLGSHCLLPAGGLYLGKVCPGLIHFVLAAGPHCSPGLSSLAAVSDHSFSRSESDSARWLNQA